MTQVAGLVVHAAAGGASECCELRATVLPESSSGEFKFKVVGLLLPKDIKAPPRTTICREGCRPDLSHQLAFAMDHSR